MPPPLSPLKQPDECTLPCVIAISALFTLVILLAATCLIFTRRLFSPESRPGRFAPERETPPAQRRSRWQRTYRAFSGRERLVYSPLAISPDSVGSLAARGLVAEEEQVLRRERLEEEEEDERVARELYEAVQTTSEEEGEGESDSSVLWMVRSVDRRPSRWQRGYVPLLERVELPASQ